MKAQPSAKPAIPLPGRSDGTCSRMSRRGAVRWAGERPAGQERALQVVMPQLDDPMTSGSGHANNHAWSIHEWPQMTSAGLRSPGPLIGRMERIVARD